MAKIVTPKNAAGVITYPQTLTKAVYKESGENLDNILDGKGNANLYRKTNISVAVSSWVANTNSQAVDKEKTDYPFMATISITTPTVTTNDIARVMFGYAEQVSGNFSPNCYTTTNGVIIEAKEKPSATITLDYILIERIL